MHRPSIILMNNIYINWLQSVNSKSFKHMPIFTNMKFIEKGQPLPFGYIVNNLVPYDKTTVLEYHIEDSTSITSKPKSQLELNLILPQQDAMQYCIQWQRYRKYWWSSITTTPSLFSINEIKNEDDTSEANIIAQFPWGQYSVETVSTNYETSQRSLLKCSLTLECAIITLLLDGLNNMRKNYLRLHRNMTPYKISFALQTEGAHKTDLSELAKLLYCRLKSKNILTCIPNFTLSLEQQISENLQLGVTYTAILSESTLTNGIFHLLNSNTMLKEEVHIAAFDSYADLICRK